MVEAVSKRRIRGIVSLSRELSLGNLNPQADKPEHGLCQKNMQIPHSSQMKTSRTQYAIIVGEKAHRKKRTQKRGTAHDWPQIPLPES